MEKTRKRTKITKEIRDRIIELYKQHLYTKKEISKIVNINYYSTLDIINEYVKKNNIEDYNKVSKVTFNRNSSTTANISIRKKLLNKINVTENDRLVKIDLKKIDGQEVIIISKYNN